MQHRIKAMLQPLMLALSESSIVSLFLAGVAYVGAVLIAWLNLHLRIKAIEIRQEGYAEELESMIAQARQTDEKLQKTTTKLASLVARLEERDRMHDRDRERNHDLED